jgi:threonine dehydrogenase-like Zn-dependent dehydrogenase
MHVRTLRYLPGGGAETVDAEVGDPGAGEIQVRGTACGICAWDQHTFRLGSDGPSPAPPGHEGVAYVDKIGAGVSGFKEGDRIVGRGFATRYNMPAAQARPIPASGLPDEHWIVEPVSCVVTGLDHCHLRPADRVAVIGCGFMGLLLVQGLGHSWAEQVVAVDIAPERLELARQFGATETFDPRAKDAEDRIAELHQRGFDTVVDCSGSQQGLELATRLAPRGGRINLFGWNHGQTAFSGDAWHLGGFTVVNSSPSARLRDPFPAAIRLIDKGIFSLEKLVTHVVGLEEYAGLMQKVTAGEEPGYIKGVVRLEE